MTTDGAAARNRRAIEYEKTKEAHVKIRKPLTIAIALALASPGVAQADQVSDLKAQLETLQRQMDAQTEVDDMLDLLTDKAAKEVASRNPEFSPEECRRVAGQIMAADRGLHSACIFTDRV